MHRYSIKDSCSNKMSVMKTKRVVTESQLRSAEKLKSIFEQTKAQVKSEGKSLTYQDLADFLDVTAGAVSQFANGTTPMSEVTMLKVAKFFGIHPSEINPELSNLLPTDTGGDNNVSELTKSNNAVPLISWVQAGACQEVEAPCTASDAERWILCPVPHSSKTFALRVHGLSMRDPGNFPSFDDGDIIHVDPEVSAENKSLVVVQMNGDTEATFKQLIVEGGNCFLKALNPAWPNPIREMPGDARICGVVISKTVSYR
ncbi:XRE family transcriptional regulator [uncultured Marinobacter sp.]|uniref:LexA family protein n=1 Tax=uncultured Marinobacter sp. TaxID=187379 RepID=UPI0030D6D9C2